MNPFPKLALLACVFSVAHAEWVTPPEILEEIRSLETLAPLEAVRHYRKFANAGELGHQAKASLAHNDDLIVWLPEYFEKTPVLFENLKERTMVIDSVNDLPAEWAVRFLIDLSLDERPMKSTRFDYDDPEFQRRMEREGPGNDNDRELFLSYGYGPPGGDNQRLAERALVAMSLAGAPDMEERRERGISISTWLRQPSQARRIPEIVKETWGERAILNADLGLGPDNVFRSRPVRPLSNGRAGSYDRGFRRPEAEPAMGEMISREQQTPGPCPEDPGSSSSSPAGCWPPGWRPWLGDA